MRRVFAVFESSKVALVRVWIDSWAARGWSPQLISPREIEEAGSVPQALRRRARGGAVTDLLAINFSGRPRDSLRAVRLGRRGWQSAPVVRFPAGTSEADVFSCGRKLCLA